MDVPPADHPVWRQILTGGVRYHLDFFAAKILLGWLLLKVDSDPGEEMVAECARALHHLFAQNAQLPCVQHDLAEILHDGVAPGDGAPGDWPLPEMVRPEMVRPETVRPEAGLFRTGPGQRP